MSPARTGPIDPITLEVVVEALLSIVREMRETVIRTAYSSVVCQGHDFSCCLFDPQGQLVAQSEDLPGHVLPMSWSIRHLMESFGRDIRPGDVFMLNDPTYGGTHLNDVMVAMPVFTEKGLSLFPAVRAHWVDVGGMVPGSLSGAAQEIYQEGVVIPPIRVYDEGRPNRAALDLLFANVRLPEDRKGDFRACLAACKQAERRVNESLDRFGWKTLSACISRALDRAEERMREQIATIPPGEYFFEDYLETFEDGKFVPVRGCVRLEVRDRRVTADFTGSSPQVRHPINSSLGVTASGVFIPLKTVLDPDFPVNHGSFRPVRLIVPEKTIFNARRPAPVGGFVEVRKRVISVVMGALAQAIPERVAADQYGTAFHNMIGGVNPRTGRPFVYYEWPKGGSGGYAEADGQNAMAALDEGDTRCIHSAEVLENEFPVMMECSTLRTDSGGAGKRRGGLGVKRQVRLLCEGAYSLLADRAVLPSYGLDGGRLGRPTAASILRRGEELPLATPGKSQNMSLRKGDRLVMLSGGGGGYGDPLTRPLDEVKADVLAGYISREEAEASYGVALDGSGEIDRRRTAVRRRGLAGRSGARVEAAEAHGRNGFSNGRRICIVGRGVASRLGLHPGEVVELRGKKAAPLRAWVEVDGKVSRGGILLDGFARSVIGVKKGNFVRLSKIDNPSPETGALRKRKNRG
ncbi:MAG: hydantoinase B/oxoprolinase family protein [Nitrospinota bacterium]